MLPNIRTLFSRIPANLNPTLNMLVKLMSNKWPLITLKNFIKWLNTCLTFNFSYWSLGITRGLFTQTIFFSTQFNFVWTLDQCARALVICDIDTHLRICETTWGLNLTLAIWPLSDLVKFSSIYDSLRTFFSLLLLLTFTCINSLITFSIVKF